MTPLARSLVHFIETGAISQTLKTELRRLRAEPRPHQQPAARLLQYCAGRADQLGPIDRDFGRICDQIDRADVMLAGLRERARQGLGPAERSWPDIDGPRTIALARRDPESDMVTLVVDATTANITMFAVAAYADEREAHLREVQRVGESLPEGSYGRRNREAIATRETRVAARLRAVQQAYRTAIEHGAALSLPESPRAFRSREHVADREIELE